MDPESRERRLHALVAKWREGAKQADRWAAEHDAKHDGANSHAFRKERRIWTTCADELAALLVRESRQKEQRCDDSSATSSDIAPSGTTTAQASVGAAAKTEVGQPPQPLIGMASEASREGPPESHPSVTRFEVIDETGRVFYRRPCELELSFQDNGRTLKIFVKGGREGAAPPTPIPQGHVDAASRFERYFKPVPLTEAEKIPITSEGEGAAPVPPQQITDPEEAAGIMRGLADVKAGRVRPLKDIRKDIREGAAPATEPEPHPPHE